MQERLYEKSLNLAKNFVIIFSLFMGSIQLAVTYILTQNILFYASYSIILMVALVFSVNSILDLRNLKNNLNLFVTSDKKEDNLPILSIRNLEDRALKVCLCYRNGATLTDIKTELGFSHPTEVKRELIKGLDILLKSYSNRKEKN